MSIKEKAIELRKSGVSIRKIAKKLNVPLGRGKK